MKTTKAAAVVEPSVVSMRVQALDVVRRHAHSQRGDDYVFNMMARVVQAVHSAEAAYARAWRIIDEVCLEADSE